VVGCLDVAACACAGEDAEGRKCLEVRQADRQRLPAAHGKPGHGAMIAIGKCAVTCIDEGDYFGEENIAELIVEHSRPGTGAAWTSARGRRRSGGADAAARE